MNPEILLDAVLRGVLGGRRRKRSRRALAYLTGRRGGSLLNASTLLGAAGVAWGVFETLQNQQAPAAASAPPVPPAAPPPLPVQGTPAPAASDDQQADALRLVRVAISAANADSAMSEVERAAVLRHATEAGVADLVAAELASPLPLAAIVAGVQGQADKATLYVLAYTVARADEQVSGAERIYLARLASLLGLAPATAESLEQDVSARIDARE